MRNYNVLDEVRAIASQYELKKPDYITDVEWAVANPETKSLFIQVEDLEKSLKGAYWEAARQKDWERAFLIYQRLIISPYLYSITPEIYGEEEFKDREGEYIARAKEWVCNVTRLLG